MSRVALPRKGGGLVVVGIDPPLQCWFAQVYGPDEDDAPVESLDTNNKGELLELIEKYADRSDPKVEEVMLLIALDQDPGKAVRR